MFAFNSFPDDAWVIDSGASHHMCNNRDLFLPHTMTSVDFAIRLGDKTTVRAVEKGVVPIGTAQIKALFVPRFRVSLLSVSCLDAELGWSTRFGDGRCRIVDASGATIFQTSCSRGLYHVRVARIADGNLGVAACTSDGGPASPQSARRDRTSVSARRVSPALWHRRLAHCHPTAMRRALDTIPGVSHMDTSGAGHPAPCIMCIRAKMKQQINRQPVDRCQVPFELVHSDLCGPMPASIGGASYYILYIDDCTRYAEVFSLVSKSAQEIIEKFRTYKAWVKTLGYRIRRFRCDNGTGEYANAAFLSLLMASGIAFEPSPPYTQHKNGVSERMIQTLNSKARCLLLDSGLPSRFWAEAIKTSVYLHRRTPTASLPNFQNPSEALYGTRPPLHHLRRFGCVVYRHIPKEQRNGKFDERARPCMFLGYVHKTTKIYRIWDFAGRGRALESSNIRFVENENAWLAKPSPGTGNEHPANVFPGMVPNIDDVVHESDESAQLDDGDSADMPPRDPGRSPASAHMPVGDPDGTYHSNKRPPRDGVYLNPAVL